MILVISILAAVVVGVYFSKKQKSTNAYFAASGNIPAWAVGISAFHMSARVVHKLGLEEDNQNFLLMHSVGVNVSGQIASVIAGGLILALVKAQIGG